MGQSGMKSQENTPDAFTGVLTTMHDNLRLTARQHYAAAERFRVLAVIVEYASVSVTLIAGAVGVGAFVVRQGQEPHVLRKTLAIALSVVSAGAPVAFGSHLFTYHPRELYVRHMEAGVECQALQKKIEALRRIVISQSGCHDRAMYYAWFEMLIHAKQRLDLKEKPWDEDFKRTQKD